MKVLLVANSDWGLYDLLLPIAATLRTQGTEVVLVWPEGPYSPRLREAGYRVLDWDLRRRSLNPISEARALLHLVRLYRREIPDAVHHFTIKPNVYGAIAAHLANVPHVLNTWTGLGFTFTQAPLARLLRLGLVPLMRYLYRDRRVWTVLQNEENLQVMLELRCLAPERTSLIAACGVDTSKFSPRSDTPSETPVVLMAARLLLRDKGVKEFVEAAALLRQRGAVARFQLAGAPDPGNSASFNREDADRWAAAGAVEVLGYQDDMPGLLRGADIAVLPSYHEGAPRFLLEAAATGLPLVATDIPGCRIMVRPSVNGFLVPARDPYALADALATLAADSALRARMGAASLEIAVTQFDQHLIIGQYLDIYRRLGLLPAETGAAGPGQQTAAGRPSHDHDHDKE
jgi:glycosyltransferase involved in cell wall biosynthesis